LWVRQPGLLWLCDHRELREIIVVHTSARPLEEGLVQSQIILSLVDVYFD
jgi:hypothetical protein